MKLTTIFAALLTFVSISCTSCDGKSTSSSGSSVALGRRVFGVFRVINDTTVEMNGVINGNTPAQFNTLMFSFPNIKTINMRDCPGSEDDEANLLVSRAMHQKGISFHLFSDSVIASGAVDMYLAGIRRTRDPGSRIGVHSWGNQPGEPIATALPRNHPLHQTYITYYVEMGFSQQESEDFYFFTINAATAENVHWMTEAEITNYKMTT